MNPTCRIFLALALLTIGGEGFRLWWFSDARGDVFADSAAQSPLSLDPTSPAVAAASGMRHQSDPQQQKIVDRLLGHNRSRCGVWVDEDQSSQRVHYTWVEYDKGNVHYLKDLFGHPPEVCVGKSGAIPVAIHADRVLAVGDRTIPVRHVEFRDPLSGVAFQIFKFAWLPEGSSLHPGTGVDNDLRSARLSAAWHGMPRTEARMLIAVVFGASTAHGGWQQFQRTVAPSLSLSADGKDELAYAQMID